MNFRVRICLGTLFLLGILSNVLLAQEQTHMELAYISPKPGSKYIMPENNIAFRL